jgi:Rrf2 family protein
MKFSQSVDLAIHSLVYIAHNSSGEPVMIRELARSVRASESYLARVMLWLVKAGILKSIRGKRGGFVFKKSPYEVTIADVVTVIDQDTAEYNCPWENRGCEIPSKGCPLLDLFHEAQQQMLGVLRRMSIGQIASSHNAEIGRDWLKPCNQESQDNQRSGERVSESSTTPAQMDFSEKNV